MGWIGVDLDGTLAEYESGQWPKIGKPIPKMLARVKKWLEDGEEVRILTARAADPDFDIENVATWLTDVAGLPRLQITAVKDPEMDVLWDDKAIQVKPNTGEPIVDENLQESYARTLQWKNPKKKRWTTDSNSFEIMSSLERENTKEAEDAFSLVRDLKE